MSKWWPAIEANLNWRRAELTELKLKVMAEAPARNIAPQSIAYKALLRASWGMLYAHYEGFCLYAFTLYLDELEKMKVVRGDCRYEILRYSLRHHLPKVRTKPEEDFIKFLRDGGYAELLAKAIDFPRDKKLKDEFDLGGRSNLWPQKLAECCDCCCVNTAPINPKDTRLKLLVGRRNAIAHGKDTPVRDHEEYEEYETYVLDILDKIAQAVDSAFAKCEYMETAAKHRHTERLANHIHHTVGGSDVANWYEAERRVAEGERA